MLFIVFIASVTSGCFVLLLLCQDYLVTAFLFPGYALATGKPKARSVTMAGVMFSFGRLLEHSLQSLPRAVDWPSTEIFKSSIRSIIDLPH
jgi:hypothetical protein